MKKMFLGFVATCVMCLIAACGGNAKLEGDWVADGKAILGEDTKNFNTVELVMSFDGTTMKMEFNAEMIEEKDMKMEMGVRMTAECPYTADSKVIRGDFSKCKTEADITKFKIEADEETQKALEAAGMTEENLKEAFKKEMKPDDMFKDLGVGELKIKELTDTKLVLAQEDGKEMVLTRK